MQVEELTPEQQQAIWDEAVKGETTVVEDPLPQDDPASDVVDLEPAMPNAVTPDPDPLERVTAELRELKSTIDSRLHKTESNLGRVAADVGKFRDEVAAAKAATPQAGVAPTQAQIASAANAGGEKWSRLKEDYPEWGEAIEEFVGAGARAPAFDEKALLDKVNAEVEQRAAQRLQSELPKALVELHHPGWEQKVNEQKFVDWLQSQPADVKRLADSPLPRDAIKLLDEYEAAGTPAATQSSNPRDLQAQRQARLRDAATVPQRSSTTGRAPRVSVDDMTPEQLWEYETKRVARQRGR